MRPRMPCPEICNTPDSLFLDCADDNKENTPPPRFVSPPPLTRTPHSNESVLAPLPRFSPLHWNGHLPGMHTFVSAAHLRENISPNFEAADANKQKSN